MIIKIGRIRMYYILVIIFCISLLALVWAGANLYATLLDRMARENALDVHDKPLWQVIDEHGTPIWPRD